MIKKFAFCAALGAMMLSACTSEDPLKGDFEGGNVTFTAEIPANILSRAISDGSTANKLTYVVYNDKGDEIEALTKTVDIDMSTTVSLNLVTGKTYTVVFWAQNVNAPYSLNTSTGEVTVTATTGTSQDESRDAFFAAEEFTVNGSVNKTVKLNRPFAQINVLTTDLKEFKAAGESISEAGLKVKGATSLNLKDGSVTGEADYEFTNAEFPDAGELLPIDLGEDKTVTWLVADYVLVGASKETVDVTWTSNTSVSSQTSVKYTNVPVQRNYRTNIYGALLTDAYNYDVVINPDYLDPFHKYEVVDTPEEFYDAVVTTGHAYIPEGVTIDLSELMPKGADDVDFEITQPTTILLEGELKCDNAGMMQVHSDLVILGNGAASRENARRATRGTTEITDAVINGGPRGLFLIKEGGSFYAENVTFNTPEAYRGSDVWNDGGGDVTLINCTFNSNMGCVYFQPADVKKVLTVKNCTVNSTARRGNTNPQGEKVWCYAFRCFGGVSNFENNNMTGIQGLISADSVYVPSYVNIYSGNYTIHNSGLDGEDGFYAVYTCTDGTCNIYGGQFYSPRFAVYNGNNDTTDVFGHLYLYGGKYSQKPAYDQKYHTELALPDGYVWESTNDTTYPWTVVKD